MREARVRVRSSASRKEVTTKALPYLYPQSNEDGGSEIVGLTKMPNACRISSRERSRKQSHNLRRKDL